MFVILLKQDGTSEFVKPKDGSEKFTLAELQGYVGGFIEPIELKEGVELVVNEEGKYNGSLPNAQATLIWEKYFGKTDVIFGDALYMEKYNWSRD
jgi:hypothetical protein